jgi:hypothetical protein
MKKSLLVASVAALSLSASLAHADGVGVNVGARTGYAIALGDAAEGSKLADAISGAIPLHLDATYNITPTFNAGLYLGYGLGMKGDKADNADSVSTLAYGVQGNMLFPQGENTAWGGIFAGLESATLKGKANNVDLTSTQSGWQAGLQGGYDLKATPALSWGPFASFAFGQYGSYKAEGGGFSTSGDIEKTAAHQWLTIGVRGTYGL